MLEIKAGEQGRNFTPDVAWMRNQLSETSGLRRPFGLLSPANFFSGLPLREEDSPGNWTARQTGEGLQYVWYDMAGGEHAVLLFAKRAK